MIHVRGVHHVVLTCEDMDRTVDFYTRILKMRLSASAAPSL